MNFRYFTGSLVLACISAFIFSCSSGSSSSDTSGTVDVSSVGNVNSSLNAIEGLLFDSSSESSSKLSTNAQTESNEFSFMGCHYISDRQRALDDLKRTRSPLCFIDAMESAGAFSVPSESYGYFKLTGSFPGESGPPTEDDDFVVRIGRFANADGAECIRFQACEGTTQSEYFEACNITGGITTVAQHVFNDDFGTGSGSMVATILGPAEDPTSFTLTSAFSGSFGSNDTWSGNAILTGDKGDENDVSDDANTFFGNFEGSHSFQGQSFTHDMGVCVYAGGGSGSGQVSGEHGMPPYYIPGQGWYCPPSFDSQDGQSTKQTECDDNDSNPSNCSATCQETFTHLESFRIEGAEDNKTAYILPNDQSSWFSSAEGCTIPEETSPASFTETWDCSAPSGFTEIDLSTVDSTEILGCIEMDQDHEDQPDNCEQQRNNDEKEDHGQS